MTTTMVGVVCDSKSRTRSSSSSGTECYLEEEEEWWAQWLRGGFADSQDQTRDMFAEGNRPWPRRKKNQVLLEGYVETPAAAVSEDDDSESSTKAVTRTKSLTDDDLDELKGCVDLGFGFSYEEIPELCNTLPALELCYSMSQKFNDEQQRSPESASAAPASAAPSAPSPPTAEIANWKISSPGDHPEDVKARLKFWAQTVACTIRLCS